MDDELKIVIKAVLDDSAEKDLGVKNWAPVLDIVDIKGATFAERNVAAAGNLGETSKPRFYREKQAPVAIIF